MRERELIDFFSSGHPMQECGFLCWVTSWCVGGDDHYPGRPPYCTQSAGHYQSSGYAAAAVVVVVLLCVCMWCVGVFKYVVWECVVCVYVCVCVYVHVCVVSWRTWHKH